MRNPRLSIWLSVAIVLVLLAFGCGKDDVVNPPEPLGPPGNVFGVPILFEADDMTLMWTETSHAAVEGYNVYKQVGSGTPVKLNEFLITATSFGPGAYFPEALWFSDTLYDTASSELHKYYVTAVNAIEESGASNMVTCTPNTIDPAAEVANLWPDTVDEVDQVPGFTWDAEAGASSYFLILGNVQDNWTWWIFRVTSNQCTYKVTQGTTYLDAADDNLFPDHNYQWYLWAIDNNNCGFASALADFVTTNPNRVAPLVNTTAQAGRYRICWDQIDKNGLAVPVGGYIAHMQVGMFDTTILFDIVDGTAPVNPPPNCDTTFDELPSQFLLQLNGSTFNLADTVEITFDLPTSSEVIIEINK